MEREACFDLEESAIAYINLIDRKGLLGNQTYDELLDHLMTEAENLTDAGLPVDEAFEVSKVRLGKEDFLTGEFDKINRRRRISYLFSQGILIFLCMAIINSILNLVWSAVLAMIYGDLGTIIYSSRIFFLVYKAISIIAILFSVKFLFPIKVSSINAVKPIIPLLFLVCEFLNIAMIFSFVENERFRSSLTLDYWIRSGMILFIIFLFLWRNKNSKTFLIRNWIKPLTYKVS